MSLLKVQVDTSHYPAKNMDYYSKCYFFKKEKDKKMMFIYILLEKIIYNYKHDSICSRMFLLSSMETGVIFFSSCLLSMKHTK